MHGNAPRPDFSRRQFLGALSASPLSLAVPTGQAKATTAPTIPPPDILRLEQELIGQMIREHNKSLVAEAFHELLSVEDFSTEGHRKICRVVIRLCEEERLISPVEVGNALAEQSRLEEVGGRSYLDYLSGMRSEKDAEEVIRLLRDKAILHRLNEVAEHISRAACGPSTCAENLVHQTLGQVIDIAARFPPETTVDLHVAILDALEQLDSCRENNEVLATPRPIRALPFELQKFVEELSHRGLTCLDQERETSVALDFACHVIRETEIPMYLVSPQFSATDIVHSLLCAEASIDAVAYREGNFGQRDVGALIKASSRLNRRKVFIDDRPAPSVVRIAGTARRLKESEGIALVVVAGRNLGPAARGRFLNQLAVVAREMELPIVVG